MTSRLRHRPRAQRGISLIISLILLVIVTLLASGSMRGVVLQTRMSGNAHDRGLAFQAAEAALREAERRAATLSASSFPAADCTGGLCAQPALAATPRWLDDTFASWQASGAAVPAGAPEPQTIIEDMGDGPGWPLCENEVPRQANCSTRRFRVTARSTADGRASVLVQSQYAAP
jgi:type IV pilus assembly protein PilX